MSPAAQTRHPPADATTANAGALRFTIRALVETGVLVRVLTLFSQRSILPTQVLCRQEPDTLVIQITTGMLDEATGMILLEKLRQIVTVTDASLTGTGEP